MSEHQRETEFLQRIILYNNTDERRELEKKIAQVQRDQRCVQRVTSVAGICAALAIVGLAYPAILEDNFPYSESQFVIKVLCNLGLASLICLLGFAGVLMVYRKKLNRLREECRQLITTMLTSRMGEPHLAAVQGNGHISGNGEFARGAAEGTGAPRSVDTLLILAANGENRIIR